MKTSANWKFGVFGLLLGMIEQPALAGSALIGNTSPGTRLISVQIDGQTVAQNLGYLQFFRGEIAPGSRQLRIVDSLTGEVLVPTLTWNVPEGDGLWLSLAGDGGERRFVAARTVFLSSLPPGSFKLVLANAAVDLIEFSSRCPDPDNFSFGAGRSSFHFGTVGMSATTHRFCRGEPAAIEDNVRTGLPALNLDNQADELRYLAYVGNGTSSYPFKWVQISDGVVSSPLLSELSDTLRLLKSVNYWYDSGRFSQGVTLYEVSRTLAVHGFWNTYASDGRPQWFYLDGGVVDPSGRREVLIHDFTIDANGKRVGKTMGRGTLTYVDCNEAELQVSFADGSSQAARFRRSVSVSSCDAVP